jgi:nitrile hydratase subunit alpha
MEALLIEKGFVTEAKIQDNIAFMNSRSPANGAGLVARAWVVGGFKARLHSDVRAAAV